MNREWVILSRKVKFFPLIKGAMGQLPIELNEAGNNLELKAQVPCLNPDDLDVAVNSDSVTISGEYRYEDI